MTGPEHYREGEAQLQAAKEQASDGFHDEAAVTTQFALAHFAAALAAATAMAAYPLQDDCGLTTKGMHEVDFDAWNEVAGAASGD